jgi:hypothetical protein
MADRDNKLVDYNLGQNIKLYNRIKSRLQRVGSKSHDLRLKFSNAIVTVTPTWDNDNIQPGTAAGAIMAGIVMVSDEFYVPINADTEIVATESVENGTKYTVNVDSPFEQQARFRAMMESGTGFTSLITDDFEYGESEVLNKRVVRDTWRYEITVQDPELVDDLDDSGIGFGIL